MHCMLTFHELDVTEVQQEPDLGRAHCPAPLAHSPGPSSRMLADANYLMKPLGQRSLPFQVFHFLTQAQRYAEHHFQSSSIS